MVPAMRNCASYFKLLDPRGLMVSGSPRLADIETRRASLIFETELRLDCERRSLAQDLGYLVLPKYRAASIRLARRRIAPLKAEINHWKTATVERVVI